MGSPVPAGLTVLTAAAAPAVWHQAEDVFQGLWPEYNQHGDVAGEYFGVIVPRFAGFQFLLYDEAEHRPVARGRSIPFRWDGSLADLPAGIDALGQKAMQATERPNALSALAAEVVPDRRGEQLSRLVVQTMAEMGAARGLGSLIAPVRPSWKERYPLISIERYASWQRADGLPFDPWMRVHARLGGVVLRAAPQSMHISGSVREWESWTGMAFPADGTYTFPAGLAPLEVRHGQGDYWEPNVWMLHQL
jgi:hypothetical protein